MRHPIVRNVQDRGDGLGPFCADCYGEIYLEKIERGPRIGTRLTYRHIEQQPACFTAGISIVSVSFSGEPGK